MDDTLPYHLGNDDPEESIEQHDDLFFSGNIEDPPNKIYNRGGLFPIGTRFSHSGSDKPARS